MIKEMSKTKSGARVQGVFKVKCIRPDGSIRWEEEVQNLITNVGLNFILDNGLNSTEAGTIYLGLKNAGSPAAGDTMSSHAAGPKTRTTMRPHARHGGKVQRQVRR